MALGKNRQQGNYGYQGSNNGYQKQNNGYQNNNQQRESWGLWVNTSQAGKEYLTFEINGVKYMAFENTKKNSDKSPDYFIVTKDSLGQKTGYQGGYQPNNGYNNYSQQNNNYVPNNTPVYQQPKQENYVNPNQGSEGGTTRNPNVGASEPQNPSYQPDPLDGLSL